MTQEIVYDKSKNAIVYTGGLSSESWDSVWQDQEKFLLQKAKTISKKDRVLRLVRKFAPEGSRVLEGGCGLGQFVYSLDKFGYRVTGIDYAEKTVALIKEKFPHLDIRLGDVTNLKDIGDGAYDVYYSGGVIEHFYDGYDDILNEMYRTLDQNGVLIITFPSLTPKRRQMMKNLPQVESIDPNNFYQFALDQDEAIQRFEKRGFKLLHKKIRNGLRGYIEYNPEAKKLSDLYHYKGHNKFKRGLRYAISEMLCYFGYGHTIELVFQKIR